MKMRRKEAPSEEGVENKPLSAEEDLRDLLAANALILSQTEILLVQIESATKELRRATNELRATRRQGPTIRNT